MAYIVIGTALRRRGLPFTGLDALGIAWLAASPLVGGVALTIVARR